MANINKILKSIERMKKREKSESVTTAVQYPILNIFKYFQIKDLKRCSYDKV